MARAPIPPGKRFEILMRDSFRCVYCGAEPIREELVVDHLHPQHEGGGHERENLVTACVACNQGKSSIAMDATLVEAIRQRAALHEQAILMVADAAPYRSMTHKHKLIRSATLYLAEEFVA